MSLIKGKVEVSEKVKYCSSCGAFVETGMGYFSILFLILFASIAVLWIIGISSDSDPNDGYCSTTSYIVKNLGKVELGLLEPRSAGKCIVVGEGSIRTVKYAYSTIVTRKNREAPIPYKAEVAYNKSSDTYYVCEITYFPHRKDSKPEKESNSSFCLR